MLRSFEDFVNRPANDKIVYNQEKKWQGVNLPLIDSVPLAVLKISFVIWLLPTHPSLNIFIEQGDIKGSRKAKSPRCKSFLRAFSKSIVGYFVPLELTMKDWRKANGLISPLYDTIIWIEKKRTNYIRYDLTRPLWFVMKPGLNPQLPPTHSY